MAALLCPIDRLFLRRGGRNRRRLDAHNLFYTALLDDKRAHAFSADICLQCYLSGA